MSARVEITAPSLERNPNPYDDEAFMRASNEFQDVAGNAIEMLWEAGARRGDFESEIANVLDALEESV